MNAEIQNYRDNKRKKEMIDGRMYLMASPSIEHRDVQGNLFMVFNNYFKHNKRRCRAVIDHQIYINEKNFYEPDVKVLCRESADKLNFAQAEVQQARHNDDIPIIVIEVLSKSTVDLDRGVKMEKYAALGIKEYWIITWEMALIEIYLLTDTNEYKRYKTYAYYSSEEELKRLDEDELKEVVNEFSPVSFPELTIKLEDVFDIFA